MYPIVMKNKKNFKAKAPASYVRSAPPKPFSPKASSSRPQQRGGAQDNDGISKKWRCVTGTHSIAELLKVRSSSVEVAWLKQGWNTVPELRELEETLKKLRIRVVEKPLGLMDRWASGHQGAILFSSQTPELDLHDGLDQASSIFLILDGIEDPHNLGAILRTSWLTGVSGVLTPANNSVGLTSTVHKVACGGVEHVPVDSESGFATSVEELKKQGYWVYGLSHKGKKSLYDLELPERVVWCIGSEDKGMRITTERLCDELIFIPQKSAEASYNASAATAIALSETKRQHLRQKNK